MTLYAAKVINPSVEMNKMQKQGSAHNSLNLHIPYRHQAYTGDP